MAKDRFRWQPRLHQLQEVPALVEDRLILSLCDASGVWPEPYEAAGYRVECIDAARGDDVRFLRYPSRPVYGILAAPPCEKFSQWSRNMNGEPSREELLHALSIVDACLRLVAVCRPVFWALENPSGRLRDYLGRPSFTFDPADFGGYLQEGEARNGVEFDAYRKRTLLWGRFTPPQRRPVAPVPGDWTTRTPPHLRSVTPLGFARAFMEANP